ncbi:MAG TPA: YcxB family protein [Anaerolineae bacterium]
MDQIDVTFTYEEPDVVSAQRLRFRHSARLKLLAAIGVLALLVPVVQVLAPGALGRGVDPALLAGVAAVFLLVPSLTYLLGPFLDYRRNRFWQTALNLRLSAAGLRLALADAATGQEAIEIAWEHLHHLLENDDVLVFFFGDQQSYIVVPKRALGGPAALAFVRGLMAR